MCVLTATESRAFAVAELATVLPGLRDPEGQVTWIHAEPGRELIQALDDMGLDEIAVKSLREGPERPRVEEFTDHLYISLFSADGVAALKSHGNSSGENSDVPRLRELRLFVGSRWIITVGRIDEADYEVLAERVRRQVFSRQRGPSFVAYVISEWLVESLQPLLERLDDHIDSLQDRVVVEGGDAPMRELFGLKRDLVDLRRRVAPLRDVMQRLGAHGVLYIDEAADSYFRDVHDDVLRVIELLDTYRDILASALDLHMSSVSNRLNQVMKRLTVVATLFMPLSFIVGFFGTNFDRMPFGSSFWFVMMFVMLIVSLLAMLMYTWKRK